MVNLKRCLIPRQLWKEKLEQEHASALLARTGPLSSTLTSRFVSERVIGLTDKPAGRLGTT